MKDQYVVWDAVSGATDYRIYATKIPGLYAPPFGITPKNVGNVTSGFITLPDPGVWYIVVTALNSFGESGFSVPDVIIVYTAGGRAGPVASRGGGLARRAR